jgi:hypothetical protein
VVYHLVLYLSRRTFENSHTTLGTRLMKIETIEPLTLALVLEPGFAVSHHKPIINNKMCCGDEMQSSKRRNLFYNIVTSAGHQPPTASHAHRPQGRPQHQSRDHPHYQSHCRSHFRRKRRRHSSRRRPRRHRYRF